MTQPNYVAGQGPSEPDLLFVGEAPGKTEDYLGRPFVGPTGELLDEILREIGIDRRQVYITNVIKYRPPDNKLKNLHLITDKHGEAITIDRCIDQLWDEIRAINPKCIVTFGNLALKAIFGKGNGSKGIMQWRGSCLPTLHMDYKGVATIHPAALLHSDDELSDGARYEKQKKGPLSYSYRHILKLDLLRALKQSKFRGYNPPNRVLEIAKDHITLQRFLDLYKHNEVVSVDIEVIRAVPYCVALTFNDWHGISIPLLDVFGWKDERDSIAPHILAEMWMIVADLLDSGIKVIGQNFKFDQGALWRHCGIRIKNVYADTSFLAHALHPEFPKALQFLTSIYTEEPYYKDEGREFDWKKDRVERVLHYNARDAVVTFEVFTEMMKDAHELKVPGFPNWVDDFFFNHQMKLHDFYRDLESVGFRVNHKKKRELTELYKKKIEVAQMELNVQAGWEVNTRSPKQMAILLYNQLKMPLRKGADEDVITALIANHCARKPLAKSIMEQCLLIRRLRKAKETYFDAETDYDGRMRTSYNALGTETGRSSTKLLKPPLRPTKVGLAFQTITKHGDVGPEIREIFIADSGYLIVETDMSQAEARIVALLGNDTKLLKLFADKVDVHTLTSSWIFGVPPNKVTKDLRFIGKTTRHAGNYDMGKHRLMEIVNADAKKFKIDISISEYKAGKILDAFHNFSPNIRGVFHQEVQKSLQDNNRILINPFGRYRQFFGRAGRELWKEGYSHIPQSTVPDHLRRAAFAAKDRFKTEDIDARFVLEAHDALVGLVREDCLDRYIQIMHEEIEQPIDFSRCTIPRGLLIIPAETKIGFNYKDLTEFKYVKAA